MHITFYKLRWWAVILFLLALAGLMALGNYMDFRQEEAMSMSDNPDRQQELKKEVRNRQSMYLLLGVAGISLVWGISSAVRRRRHGDPCHDNPGVSVTVKDGYLQATGTFHKLELWNLNGKETYSTTQPAIDLTHIKNGRFLLNVHTPEGSFSRPLRIENHNEVRKRPEHWSLTTVEYKG